VNPSAERYRRALQRTLRSPIASTHGRSTTGPTYLPRLGAHLYRLLVGALRVNGAISACHPAYTKPELLAQQPNQVWS